MADIESLCLLGFGEVGSRLAGDLAGLADRGVDIVAWDRDFLDADTKAAKRLGDCPHVRAATAADIAATGCDLVISAVTAEQDLDAARSVLPGLTDRAWFLDLNSVAPATKQAVADAVEAAGGRYVEAAVMSPIEPKGVGAPMLLGGPQANAFLPVATALGFAGAEVCSSTIGCASATKMCRSVVIKGMESLLTESLLAARHYGVEDRVLATLGNLFPHEDWPALAHYMISRSVEHGGRRAEEMREVAKTVRDAGIEPLMSTACAKRQAEAAAAASIGEADDLARMLDAMLARYTRERSSD